MFVFRGVYIRSSTIETSKGVCYLPQGQEEWMEGCVNPFLLIFCILLSFNILKILLAKETGPSQGPELAGGSAKSKPFIGKPLGSSLFNSYTKPVFPLPQVVSGPAIGDLPL